MHIPGKCGDVQRFSTWYPENKVNRRNAACTYITWGEYEVWMNIVNTTTRFVDLFFLLDGDTGTP